MTHVLLFLLLIVVGPPAIAGFGLLVYAWCEFIGSGRFMGRKIWRGLLP